jgi:hypothetical protein
MRGIDHDIGGYDEEPPGLRPKYGPDYFGAYVRDPAGRTIHFVYRGGQAPSTE